MKSLLKSLGGCKFFAFLLHFFSFFNACTRAQARTQARAYALVLFFAFVVCLFFTLQILTIYNPSKRVKQALKKYII